MRDTIKYKTDRNEEFQEIIQELITNDTVQEMNNFRQHFNTTCFEHCYFVAYHCYIICKKCKLDYKSVTRAAMLHDLFLYDWRVKDGRKNIHAFTHGKIACENACKLFELSDKEKDMIIKHMWPVTLKVPKSIEGFILTIVDKYSAINEMFEYFCSSKFVKRTLKYAYVLLCLFIFQKR